MAAAKSLIPNTKSERQPLGSLQMKSIGKRSYHFAQSQKCMGPYKCCSSLQQACFFSWANLRLCSFSSRSLSEATFPSRKFRSPILPVCLVWYKSEPWNVWLFELKKKKKVPSLHSFMNGSECHKLTKNQKINCPLFGVFSCSDFVLQTCFFDDVATAMNESEYLDYLVRRWMSYTP